MAKVDRRELPDAAETEAKWSSVVTTELLSHDRDIQEGATSHATNGSDAGGSDRLYFSDTSLRSKDETCKTRSEPQHKKWKLPACEGMIMLTIHRCLTLFFTESNSEREVIAQTRERLKEDDFFLMT